jgi:enoyl-CoA hydratase
MTNSNENVVLYEQRGSVAIITLNRPKAYNALSRGLLDRLISCIEKAENDDTIHAIILTGNGKAFSAGVDLKELTTNPGTLNEDKKMIHIFKTRQKPMIGAINGFAITGALELTLSCDLLYASENAVFADTHTKVGIMSTWGMSQRLPRLIGYGRAKEMTLSGRKIDAQTALSWGLVNRVFPQERLLDEAIKLATEISQNNQKVVKGMKSLIDKGRNMGLADALEYEYTTSHQHNDFLDFSDMMKKLSQLRGK